MSVGGTCSGGYSWELLIKFDIQILETMFDIVLKFHDQTLSVVEVSTIPVIIQKRYAAYLFIGRSNNYNILCLGNVKQYAWVIDQTVLVSQPHIINRPMKWLHKRVSAIEVRP